MDDRIIRALLGLPPVDPAVMTDALPYPVLPGQAYAMDYSKRTRGIPDAVPRGGEGGGGKFTAQEREVEKALEQIRRENAGLTREQRREKMRQEGEAEFQRGATMSDAEWDAIVREAFPKRQR